MEKNELLIKMVLKHEGGWVNDPADTGKATYQGISSKYHPMWEGWEILKRYEPLKYNEIVDDPELEKCVIDVYTADYYNPMKIDKVDNLMLSAHMFCHCVNAGCSAAVKLLQKSINKVYGINMLVDGRVGPKTLEYANKVDKINNLIKEYIKQRKDFYNNIVKRNPSQKKFLKGWIARVDGTTNYINANSGDGNGVMQQDVMFFGGSVDKFSIIKKVIEFILKLIFRRRR